MKQLYTLSCSLAAKHKQCGSRVRATEIKVQLHDERKDSSAITSCGLKRQQQTICIRSNQKETDLKDVTKVYNDLSERFDLINSGDTIVLLVDLKKQVVDAQCFIESAPLKYVKKVSDSCGPECQNLSK